ncbi:MAG: MYXO-CTERM sorting domain-containing protein [Myxococcota bacterium]
MVLGWVSLVAVAGTGPFAVGWSDEVVVDGVAGTVQYRVFYPAVADAEGAAPDTASGPFPLAGFMHGWLGSAWMYDDVCDELASWGYVVGSVDTETGLVLDMDRFADDAVAMLHALDDRSADPADPLLAGLVSGDDWTALGHSMGGATLGKLLGMEPRIRTAVAFMPYEGLSPYYEAVRGYDGSLLVLSGTNDTTAPPPLQEAWMDAADTAGRAVSILLQDVGHTAVTDLTFNDDPIPDDVERELVIRLGTTFVRAEHGGEEDLWAELIGPSDDVRTFRSRSHDPIGWATLDGATATFGVAALEDATADATFGVDAALSDPSAAGDVALSRGVGTASAPLPAGSGDVWLGIRTDGPDGEVWTRSLPLVVAEPPTTTTGPTTTDGDPSTTDPSTTDPTDPSTTDPSTTDGGSGDDDDDGTSGDGDGDDAGCGCATGPIGGLAVGWLAVGLAGFVRRRR